MLSNDEYELNKSSLHLQLLLTTVSPSVILVVSSGTIFNEGLSGLCGHDNNPVHFETELINKVLCKENVT